MNEPTTQEVAEAEFERFCEAMDLDVDESAMDDDDKAGLRKSRDLFVKAVMQGRLEVNDSGEPVYHYEKPGGEEVDIVFYEPTGTTFQAADKGKKDQNMGRMMLIMASQTKQSPKLFAGMLNRHFKVCSAVTQLFLG